MFNMILKNESSGHYYRVRIIHENWENKRHRLNDFVRIWWRVNNSICEGVDMDIRLENGINIK